MRHSFGGKVVLVTGGATGIGRATAQLFARRGAQVVVCDVNDAQGGETVDSILEEGGEATYVHADVAQDGEVEDLVHAAVSQYARLDIAFNNAGISIEGEIHELAEADWDRLMNVNLKGVWLCMKYEVRQMLRQGGGRIVNNSSIWGMAGMWGEAPYVAAKHGVTGLTRAAALDYAQRGIRVNQVCPGIIHTPMTASTLSEPSARARIVGRSPMGRVAMPEEVAQAVAWLCSDEASFVTGHALAVDGGYLAK